MASMATAQEVIKQLNLAPHPEKGFYIQTFEGPERVNGRSRSTAIYYLLEEGLVSHWHRVLDAVEIWHYYAGTPLQLTLSWDAGQAVRKRMLGADIFLSQSPHLIVEKGEWQRAESLGAWTLVGSTVAPGFTPDVFEMAKPGWEPQASQK